MTHYRTLSAGLLALLLTAAAFAQNYPSKPVRFMVGFAAGGAADIIRMSVSEG